jgi:hypothetical protein
LRVAIVTGESLPGAPGGRRARGPGTALRVWLSLAVAGGLAFGGGVLAGGDQARIRQEIALALDERQALSARGETLREQAAALEARLTASLERGRLRILENNAAR